MSDDVITRDENGDLAVRTVTATEESSGSQYDDLYARTTDGKRALRVVGGGTSSSLPEQAGHTGFLQTDGTNASWSDKIPFTDFVQTANRLAIGTAAGANAGRSTAIGILSSVTAGGGVTLGQSSSVSGNNGVALGLYSSVSAAGAIQINTSGALQTNADSDTFKIANHNGNFQLMSADGTIPSERLAASGTSGQVLSKTDTGMEWVDMGDESRDYLPLSGGALNVGATLTFNAVEGVPGATLKPDVGILNIMQSDLSAPVFTFMVGNANFYSRFRTLSALGTSNYPWKTAYITQLNNGVDIGIPTDSPEGGKIVVATPPVDVGTYVLKAIVAEDGTVTTEWVAE